MKTLTKFAVATAFVFAGIAGAQAQAITELKLGTEGDYPPFNALNANKELVGFEIDYGNALCEKMKVKCTWVVQDWDGIIPALLAKKYDVIIAGMNATEERAKRVDFSAVYTKTPISMISAKATTSNDLTPAALKGKAIGAQGSTIHANWLEKHYKDSNIRLYPKQEDANLDLLNGRLDYIVADRLALEDFLNAKGKDCCRLVGDVARDPVIHGPGVGMAVRKEDGAIKAMLDKAIAESMADGTHARIAAKWFKFPIM
jgi:polar amino acid transport system substrate-binding protein